MRSRPALPDLFSDPSPVSRPGHPPAGPHRPAQALPPPPHVHWHTFTVDQAARSQLKQQRPCVIWLTGLSGAGKSTIANALEQRLHAMGRHTYLLDGDNVRRSLNGDLGFSPADRAEHLRRVVGVCELMVDAGLIVIAAFISPMRADRQLARTRLGSEAFLEVHIDAPLAVTEARDPKGLYRKARRGEITQFTGIDAPYEAPLAPDLRIDTTRDDVPMAVHRVVDLLVQQHRLRKA